MKYTILVLALVLLAFVGGMLVSRVIFTGNVIRQESIKPNYYSWTKAVCNSGNECIDVQVTCENGKVAGIEPVSQILKKEASWTDDRNISEFC